MPLPGLIEDPSIGAPPPLHRRAEPPYYDAPRPYAIQETTMAERDARIDRLLLSQEITEFLYREAELLDERRYREWLDLLADDIRYWMPMRRNVKYGDDDGEFTRALSDVNWFDEGKDTLSRRVKQIETGIH